MKTQLSSLLPVSQACAILGEARVSRIVYSLLSLQQQQQQNIASGGKKPNLQEETQELVQAMLYTTNAGNTASTSTFHIIGDPTLGDQSQNLSIPPPIRAAWKRLLSRTLMLDKLALIKFCVPACAQPHAGPGGHMGLYDCLVYALQQKATGPNATPSSVTAATSTTASGPALVSIPDVCIFLAICKAYLDLQHQDTSTTIASFSREEPTILNMARWMFFVYDSYQKKGVVTRDTLHRFLSDVYGEDSYKTPAMRDLLGRLFADTPNLTCREFIKAIQDTMSLEPHPTHVLLDWMAILANAIQPSPSMPESTIEFLQTIDKEVRFLPNICNLYYLAENRLYEIKRRFHSLVESTSTVIQGDPMRTTSGGDEETEEDGGDMISSSLTNRSQILPKHVISLSAFCKAVCEPNDELGHGGYLPIDLATRVFQSVATKSLNSFEVTHLTVQSDRGKQQQTSPQQQPKQQLFWDLTHVLQFGGMAVRSSTGPSPFEPSSKSKEPATSESHPQTMDEVALIKWLVEVFTNGASRVLSRQQLEQLLKSLCDHYLFRMQADAPPFIYPEDEQRRPASALQSQDGMVDVGTASILGLLPKHLGSSQTISNNDSNNGNSVVSQVPLALLVDTILKEVGATDEQITVDQLLAWQNSAKTDLPRDQRRLGPLLMEFRLMASVLFGVPPKYASMELAILQEVSRRHKYRYPQTDVSRRGPRGTVWYIIDDLWYRTWQGLIEKVSKTPEDGQDLRDKPSAEATPRRLGRISNKGLLRENGSLALRVDIKWRHDYEIIPPLAWSALQAWYDGGPPIHRTVVPYIPSPGTPASPHSRSSPRYRTENEIELYPFFVTVFMCDATSRGEARPFQQQVPVSRVSPVRVLLVQLCKGLDIDPKFGRLWIMDTPPVDGTDAPPGSGDFLVDLDLNITEQRKSRPSSGDPATAANMTLLLELKDAETGLWPRGIDGKQWAFRDKSSAGASETGDGIVGLYNMGNTCYLNSSIQCLSHTPIFRDYFTSKCYLNDINTTNPLGHQGRLAQVSAVLINSLWKKFNQQQPHQPKRVTAPGSYAPVNAPALTPKTFKESLGKFSEHFAGNEQHDAQELLAFLLGGLSEDLNRIVDKPYIEAPDSDGRPDSELADIWWSNHLKRELSIIVALFTGQYKSLLTCRSCKYESARFEPFSFLQVPLPEDDTIPVSLILYPIREGAETMKYSIRVHNNGKLHDVLVALAKVLYADEEAEANGEENGECRNADSTDGEDANRLNAIYSKRAQNMAVVDMREGYIFKIAPVSPVVATICDEMQSNRKF